MLFLLPAKAFRCLFFRKYRLFIRIRKPLKKPFILNTDKRFFNTSKGLYCKYALIFIENGSPIGQNKIARTFTLWLSAMLFHVILFFSYIMVDHIFLVRTPCILLPMPECPYASLPLCHVWIYVLLPWIRLLRRTYFQLQYGKSVMMSIF